MSANFANSLLSPLQGGMVMKNALDFTFGYQSVAAVAAAASAVTSPQHNQQHAHAVGDLGAFDQFFAASSAAGFSGGMPMGGDPYGSRISHSFSVDPTTTILGATGHQYRASNGVTSTVTSSHPFATLSSATSSTGSSYEVGNGGGVYDTNSLSTTSGRPQHQQLKSSSLAATEWLTSSGQCHQQMHTSSSQQQVGLISHQVTPSSGDGSKASGSSFSNNSNIPAVQYYPWMGIVGKQLN